MMFRWMSDVPEDGRPDGIAKRSLGLGSGQVAGGPVGADSKVSTVVSRCRDRAKARGRKLAHGRARRPGFQPPGAKRTIAS